MTEPLRGCYVPGAWVAMVYRAPEGTADGATWLLGDTPSEHVVERCWQAVSSGAGIDDVIAAIVGEGYRAVASFALVHVGDETTQLVVRGRASVELVRADGVFAAVRTEESSDWVERTIPGTPTALRLTTDAGAGGEACLPLESGVVLASVLGYGMENLAGQREYAQISEVATAVVGARPEAGGDDPAVTAVSPRLLPQPHTQIRPGDPAERMPDLDDFLQFSGDGARASGSPKESEFIDGFSWMGNETSATRPPAAPIIDIFEPRPAHAAPPAPAGPAAAAEASLDAEATTYRPAARAGVGAGADQPIIPAVRCPAGHLNDPASAGCRVCGQSIPSQEPVPVPRPPLGRLRLSNGDVVLLDRGVIFGRNPAVPGDRPGPRPSAVKLSSADDISRSHVEIRLDGWRVLAVDLDSRNGTELSGPNQPPRALVPGRGEELGAGSTIRLAPDVWIVNALTSQLGAVQWLGADSSRFHNDWDSQHRPQLHTVACALRDAASTANANVTQQESASA
jgi:FHA domain-containing protein